MNKNIKLTTSILLLFLLVIIACKRYNDLNPNGTNADKATFSKVKAWFEQNGGSYKSGVMVVDAPDGAVKVQLDWGRARLREWKNYRYVDVPYVQDNGERMVKGGADIGAASFNLVVRVYENGSYLAATRTSIYDKDSQSVQSYRLLNGTPWNVWYGNKAGQVSSGQLLDISKEQYHTLKSRQPISGSSATTKARSVTTDGNGCEIREHVTYSGNCNYSVGEEVYVRLCRNVDYTTHCPPANLLPINLNPNPNQPPPSSNPGGGGGVQYPDCVPASLSYASS